MVIPALRDASEDLSLRGAPLAVYVWLIHRLDTQVAAPVKIAGVAHALRIKPHTAGRALRVLVARGYLHRRHTGRDGYAYRLLHARLAPEVPPSGSTPAA